MGRAGDGGGTGPHYQMGHDAPLTLVHVAAAASSSPVGSLMSGRMGNNGGRMGDNGGQAVDAVIVIFSSWLRLHMKFDTNWVPWSLMTSSGSPWSFQTWSLNNRATPDFGSTQIQYQIRVLQSKNYIS